ncbi:Uncharacterized protein APZ42_016850 [Daphnia magna]|uniref:Uncharacterized protein n=1 Tax=Daphnia magna TaxID=35525 RepID=A0A165A6T9_9CRUS|nr:Uncharacterized protein APZ42_016850 [Daphnia magna]
MPRINIDCCTASLFFSIPFYPVLHNTTRTRATKKKIKEDAGKKSIVSHGFVVA